MERESTTTEAETPEAPTQPHGPHAWAVGIAVFLSGAVLLGLEIVASRVLAPTFGNSLFVWGALIGVVLCGLSIGYWLGGLLADRWPTPYLLIGAIVTGAGFVLAVPLLDQQVLDWIVTWDPGPRLDPLVASVVLFGPASVALASVSPIAVRLAARSLERVGRTAGRLFAVSTAGSIAGTFAAAFWLIPELGTDQVIATGVVALLVAAGVVAVADRLVFTTLALGAAACAATALAISLAPEQGGTLEGVEARNYSPVYREQVERTPRRLDPAALGYSTSGSYKIQEARDSRYHRILVVDDGDTRLLRFDNSYQSGMELSDPFRTHFEYTDYLELGLAYRPTAKHVLFVGLGGGSAPKRLWRDFPKLRIDVAEIDPAVVEVAHRWFAVPEDPRLRITTEDGRRYLVKNSGPWDVIVIDAFYSDSIPFHLATREFLQLARTRLAPGGVIVTNIIGSISGSSSKLLRSITKTYRSVFPTVTLYPVSSGGVDPSVLTNVILVATDAPDPAVPFLRARWEDMQKRFPGAPDLDQALRNRWERPIRFDDVPILTDDYAPTDALLLW